jgi:CRP/FNR family transcriptional regulator, cyclic AMP receptor protein
MGQAGLICALIKLAQAPRLFQRPLQRRSGNVRSNPEANGHLPVHARSDPMQCAKASFDPCAEAASMGSLIDESPAGIVEIGVGRMTQASQTLGRVPLFASLDAKEVRTLDLRCIWRKVAAGEWVIDDQSDGAEVFFVIRGHVRVVIGMSGRDLIIRDIRDGEYFGEFSAIDGQPRSASIFAVANTLVARMSANVFREAIHRHSKVCDEVLTTLVTGMRALGNRLNEQAHFNVRQRISAEILRLARGSANGRVVVSPPPTHAEFASRVGTQREPVTKFLNSLERDGVIARTRGAIVLTDTERLRKIVAEAR